ncbi:MAG: beta strand repeat-containing protein, partial [Minisyncoccota bacterium]
MPQPLQPTPTEHSIPIRRVDCGGVRSPRATQGLTSHALQVQRALHTKALARGDGAMRFAPSMLATPSGVHEAVVRALGHGGMHVPVHTLTPFAEFLQKFVALIVAFSMTFGTYALVDPSYARFAMDSIQGSADSVSDAYVRITRGGATALLERSREKMFFAAENPNAALAQVSGVALAFIPDTLRNIARAINSGIDDLVYAIAFPDSVTNSIALTPIDGSSVSIEIAPYARGTQKTLVNAQRVPTTAVRPSVAPREPSPVTVIERFVETERIVSEVGGISEDYLNQRLSTLETTLSGRLTGSSGGGNTTISNNYNLIAQSNNIDKLGSVTIDNSTFSGGTISGSTIEDATISGSSFAGSVSATSLSATAASSLATTTVTGNLTVTGDTTVEGTLSIPGAISISSSTISLLTNTYATTSFISAVTASTTNLTWVNATGTNATTTNFFSTNASTTNATSTNLFATIGRFTSAIINAITSYGEVSAPSFNATSTTATSTFAGGILGTRVPTLPHTFSSWAIGTADANPFDASFVINPATASGDTNLFAAAVGGSVKFLVDAEGDVFVNNLTSVGSVTLSTTSASTFTVEGDATFGDSISDTTTVNGSLVVTGTTTASTIQGNFGIGTSTPWARLSVAGVAGGTSPLFTISSSTSGFSTSTVFHINSNGWVGIGTSTPSAKFAVDAPIYIGGSGVTATSTFEGNVNIQGLLKVGTSSSYISNSDISTVGNLTVTGTTNLSGLLSLVQASTTRLSVFNKAYFGGSATSTFDSAGNLFVAGTTGIGASSVDASAVFQIDSTSKGFLPPRMTTAQKNAIGSAAAGLTVFDSSLNKLNVYNGSAWKNVGSTEINGEVTNGTTGSILFIGDGTVLGQDATNFTFSTSTNRLLVTQASSTRLSVFNKAYFGGTATTTIDSAGNLAVAGTLGVTGNTTLVNATTTNLFSTTA